MTKNMMLSARSVSRIRAFAIVGLLVGLLAVVLAIGLEWNGFGGGMVIGAGIGIAVVGVYFWGYANGVGRPVSRGGWRPSDGDGR